jgi:hypothetical protein
MRRDMPTFAADALLLRQNNVHRRRDASPHPGLNPSHGLWSLHVEQVH